MCSGAERPPTAVAAVRKSDRVADDLLARIVAGELAPGSLLPTEAELAAEYEVNRSAVRESIKRLEVHRLVRPVRRRGTEVLDPVRTVSPEVLRAMLRPGGRGADPAVLRDLLEVRELVDTEMCAAAATRRSERELTALEAALARLEASVEDADAYDEAVDELDLAVARASGNRLFEMLVHWHHSVYRDLWALLSLARRPLAAHCRRQRRLVALIRAKDADGARSHVRSHHRRAARRVLRAVEAGSGRKRQRS